MWYKILLIGSSDIGQALLKIYLRNIRKAPNLILQSFVNVFHSYEDIADIYLVMQIL